MTCVPRVRLFLKMSEVHLRPLKVLLVCLNRNFRHAYRYYGPDIVKQVFFKNTSQYFLENFLKDSLEHNRPKLLKVLLEDPRTPLSDVIRYACEFKHLETIKVLLDDPRIDPSSNNNRLLEWAFNHKHEDIIKRLLDNDNIGPGAQVGCNIFAAGLAIVNDCGVDLFLNHPKTRQYVFNTMLKYCCMYNNKYIPSLLCNRTYSSDLIESCLELTITQNEHIDIIKLFLDDKRIDTKNAFECACFCRRFDVIELLIEDGRVDPTEAIERAQEKNDTELYLVLVKSRVDF